MGTSPAGRAAEVAGKIDAIDELLSVTKPTEANSLQVDYPVPPKPEQVREEKLTESDTSVTANTVSPYTPLNPTIAAKATSDESDGAVSKPAESSPAIATVRPDGNEDLKSNRSDVREVAQLADDSIPENDENDPMNQVTSVTQLSDVRPTDWAYEALRSLVERYGVIAGYPDGTFRGNRAMTRYEFAAGLNAALTRISELISRGTENAVRKEDLATLNKLQEEFATELSVLRGRVDGLEARTAELELTQFSTTTKLEGEVIFAVSSILGGHNARDEEIPRIPVASDRVRLNLSTSFTGKDRLLTRLQAGNVVPFGTTNAGPTLTNEGRLEFDGDTGNSVGIGLLQYRFPISARTYVYLAAAGNGFVDLDASAQLTPHLDGTAVSLFALRNPIYNYDGGTGFGLRHQFNDNFELNLGYLTSNGSDPSSERGLFDGKYAALAQVIVSPSKQFKIGLTYINSYSPFSTSFGLATGSNLANSNGGTAVATNSYGATVTYTITPNFAIDGWVGYSNHRYIGEGDGQVWNWAVGLTFPDVGKEGSIAGFLIGMEPKVTSLSSGVNLGLGNGVADKDTSLHLEAFYKYHFSDHIEITPGLIWLTAPNHNENNNDIFEGVVRTVFRF
ncbi:MAG TPA: iron uptake porin [Allocoleopsis sp.]